MERKNYSLHIFNAVVPLLAYMGINMAAVVLGEQFHWSNETLNLAAQTANLVLLYWIFYRPYHKRCQALPSLLPGGREEADRKVMSAITYVLVPLLGFCCCIALNNWFSILRLNETITSYEKVAESIYSGNLAVIFLRTVILASVVEEMLMRGLCYCGISHVIGRAGGIVLSAFIFGAIHGNLLQGLYAFLLGVLFAYVYDMYDRNIFAPILAHMSANIVSVLGTTVPGVSLWMVQNFEILTILSTVVLVLSVIGIYLCRKKIS